MNVNTRRFSHLLGLVGVARLRLFPASCIELQIWNWERALLVIQDSTKCWSSFQSLQDFFMVETHLHPLVELYHGLYSRLCTPLKVCPTLRHA